MASYPLLLPAQVRAGAAATAAAPDSRRPRAGAAQGVGPGEGLVSLGRAGAIWRPCPARARAPGGHLGRAAPRISTTAAGERRPLAKAAGK